MKLQHNWARRLLALISLLLVCTMLFASCNVEDLLLPEFPDTTGSPDATDESNLIDGTGTIDESKPTDETDTTDDTDTTDESESTDDTTDKETDESGDQTEPHVHKFGEWEITTEPTCTEKGEQARECSCGEVETRSVDAIEHTYTSVVTEPTCEEKGYTTHTCECGDSYVDNYVSATGHTFGEWETTKEATCTEHGQKKRECACGKVETKAINIKGHTNVKWIIEKEPTSTEDGLKYMYCPVCESRMNETVLHATGSLGLKYTQAYDGKSYYVSGIGTCTDTDIIIPAYYNNLPVTAINAAFNNCSTITSVTILDGVTSIGKYTFHNCSSLKIVYYRGTASQWNDISIEENGNSLLTAATVYFYSETQPTDDGNYWHYVDGVPTIWHEHSYTSVVTAPTCTEKGYTTHSCTCGDSYVDSYTSPQHKDEDNNSICDDCNQLFPGLYDADDNLLASWDELVNEYGMDATKDYDGSTYQTDTTSPYYILTNTAKFQGNVKLVIDNIEKIGNCAFENCSGLISVTIPLSVTSIGDWSFFCCENLESINFSNGVTSIGNSAFSICNSLTSITIPDSVTTISHWAFADCYNLASVTIPASVTSINENAFTECINLTSILVESGNPKYYSQGNCIIEKDTNTLIVGCSSSIIPNGVVSIGNSAFSRCSTLATIAIPNSVTNIGNYAFDGCTSLETIYYTGTSAQWGEITIGTDNSPLTSATVYFYSETKPTDEGNYWHYVDGVPTIWHEHNYTSVVTAPTCTEKGYTTYTCNCGDSYIDNYTDIKHKNEDNNSVCDICDYVFPGLYDVNDNMLASWDELVNTYGMNAEKDYLFGKASSDPASLYCILENNKGLSQARKLIIGPIETIGNFAFDGCDDLNSIVMSNSIKNIGTGAFYNCRYVTSIIISDSVTSIGSEAFYNCSRLTSIDIPNSVTSIGYYAFAGCGSLASIKLPNNVTSIGVSTFSGCSSLADITIPDSVTSIGQNTFYGCSSFKTVYYRGTASQWDDISIEENGNSLLTEATVYFYSEAQPTDEGNYWHYVDGVPTDWHEHNYTSVVTAPTCTEQGYTTHTCTCGDSYIDAYIDALGHEYDNDLDATCNTCGEERELDQLLVSISQNPIFGYVKGLETEDRSSASIILYNPTNSYTTTIGTNNEYFFSEIAEGTYYLKIEVTGYRIPSPIKINISDDINVLQHLDVSKVTDSDFYYQWKADDTYFEYPGKIVGVEVQVSGAPEEDKQLTVTITLNTNDDPSFGATAGIMRIFSDADTFYDLWVHAIDESNSVLQGTVTISKYACSGYWYNDQIKLTDAAGNQRFVGVGNFGWKLYINNPLADLEKPQYVKDSIRVEMEKGEIDGRPVTYIHVKFKATDNISIDTVYCEITNNTLNGYRMDNYGSFNNETGEGIITYIFTEYMQSGEYSVNYVALYDPARNYIGYNFSPDGTGAGYPATFVFNSENSDHEAPTLDVSRTTITATPAHPENPNGETLVHIEYYVKDNVSGLGSVSYRLLDPLGNTHFEYHYHENYYTMYFEGDPTVWKKYEINVILPEGSVPGKWKLSEIYVSDKAGNSETYNFSELLSFEVTPNI